MSTRYRRIQGRFQTLTITCDRRFDEKQSYFFQSIVKEDRSVLDLLSANYTFLTERLAKHYGYRTYMGVDSDA